MRFPGVGLVDVRWFFTDADPLPFTTVYNDLNWEKQTQADWLFDTGAAGEVWTADRPWRNGRSPDLSNCNGPEGSLAAWNGVSDPDSPLFHCGAFGAPFDAGYGPGYNSAAQV
jgi:hypothetical protein